MIEAGPLKATPADDLPRPWLRRMGMALAWILLGFASVWCEAALSCDVPVAWFFLRRRPWLALAITPSVASASPPRRARSR